MLTSLNVLLLNPSQSLKIEICYVDSWHEERHRKQATIMMPMLQELCFFKEMVLDQWVAHLQTPHQQLAELLVLEIFGLTGSGLYDFRGLASQYHRQCRGER